MKRKLLYVLFVLILLASLSLPLVLSTKDTLALTSDTATNNIDSRLAKGIPNTNFLTAEYYYLQRNDLNTYVDRIVLDWTLPASPEATATITQVTLYMYKYNGGNDAGGGNPVEVHELTQAFTGAVTWNKYNGVNAWTNAGGDYSATVVDFTNTPADNNWQTWDLYGGASDNPIAGLTWGSNFDIILKYDNESTGGAFQYETYRSSKSTATPANKPYIRVTYIVAPTVVTIGSSAVTSNSATLSGNITVTGDENSTTRGFEYGKVSGALNLDVHENGSFGVGNYSLDVDSLDGGTTYYYQAYATNPAGTAYGTEEEFTTEEAAPEIASWEVAGFGSTWVILKGKVVSGSPLTSQGFQYGLTDAYGSTSSGTLSVSVGSYFVRTIYNLSPATVYHWRAYGTNGAGTGYGGDAYFSTKGSPVLYEYANTLGNTSSGDIYGANYYAESFEVGNTSHSVTSIRLPLQRTGDPGTVTVSLRHADANYLPTGLDINDLDTATYNGNLLPTVGYSWVDFAFDYEYPQTDANYAYTIVVKAVSGDAANYVSWEANDGVGATPEIGSDSTNGGVTWGSNEPEFYLFEVWGNPSISIPNGGIVIQGYSEDNDMVFAAELINTYAPYYPKSTEYGQLFSFQLLGTDGVTVLASVPTRGWDDMPNFIYLSADAAAGITPGSSLYLRLYANFGNNTSTAYQLIGTDWKGSLNDLGKWCIQTGINMESYWEDLGVTTSIVQAATSDKNVFVLTSAGGAVFEGGLPQLSSKLPNFFAITYSTSNPPSMDFNPGLADTHLMADMMGDTFVADMTTMGDVFGLSATETGQAVWWGVAIILGIVVVAVSRSMVFGLFIGTGTLVAGAYLGMVNPAFIAAAAFTVLFVWGVKEFVFR